MRVRPGRPNTSPQPPKTLVRGMRYEHKYLVPERLLEPLRRRIEPFVGLDLHASRQAHGYIVRNIYFDDASFSSYFEKNDGIEMRAKPRIRGYDHHQPGGLVFLEIKRRHGAVGSKDRAVVAFEDLGELFATGDIERLVVAPSWLRASRVAARKFLFHVHRDALCPVLVECYEREPYVGLLEPSLRVTIDRHVRSALFPKLDDLFCEPGMRPSFRGSFILEVKHDVGFGFPQWLKPFITEHGLFPAALSKYWTCVADWAVVRPHSRARGHALHQWLPMVEKTEATRIYA